jgi:hypothetical protein
MYSQSKYKHLVSIYNQISTRSSLKLLHVSVTLRKGMSLLVVIKFPSRSVMDHLSAFEGGSIVDLFFPSYQRTFHEGPVIAKYLTMVGILALHVSGITFAASTSRTKLSASRAMGSPRYPWELIVETFQYTSCPRILTQEKWPRPILASAFSQG